MSPEQQEVNIQSLFSELSKALQEELNELNKTRREVMLFSGEFLSTFAEQYYYRFEIPEHIWLRNIIHLMFTFGKQDPVVFGGSVVSIDNQFLTVALPLDCGSIIPEITCSWSYDDHVLPLIQSLSTNNESSIVKKVFGLDTASNDVISDIDLQFPSTASEAERLATQKIMQNSVTFLWGTYNAGKTDTLTYIAANCLKAKKKVLMLTSNAEQADEILEKVKNVGLQLGIDVQSNVRRIGFPSFFNVESSVQLSFEREVGMRKKELREKSLENYKLLHSFWNARIKQILFETDYTKISELKEKIDEKKRQIFQVSGEVTKLQENVKRIQNASMLERMKKGFGKEDLVLAQKQYDEKLALQKRLLSIQQSFSSEIAKLEVQLPLSPNQLTEYASSLKSIAVFGGIEKVWQAFSEQTKVNRAELLQSCNLLVTSMASFLSERTFDSQYFDVILIDNAERMNLAELAVVASRAKGQLVLSGDPFLLEPESFAKTPAAARYMQQDIFTHLVGTNELTKLFDWSDNVPQSSVFLTSPQTPPHLANVLLSKVFPDKFTSTGTEKPLGKIFFIDTTYLHSGCRQYIGRKKILPYNDLQTKKTLECVKHALVLPNRVAADIGVVLPSMGMTLYTKLQLRLLGFKNVEVGTPHMFAGRRKKVIIFDTAMAGADYTLRVLDDKKAGEHFVTRLLTTILSCADEDVYILADMEHFNTRYKDRLFTALLSKLQSSSASTSSLPGSAKKFDEFEWNHRKPLYELRRTSRTTVSAHEPAKTERTKEDIERELQAKAAASQATKPTITARNFEMETFVAVNRILGWLDDINLLSELIGGGILFRHTLATELSAARIPIDYCLNEKQFSDIMHRWDLLVYQMSGAEKTEHTYFKQTPETRVRWDINALKVFHSNDIESVMEEGRKKLSMLVGKIFQECLGKVQPASPADWSTAYLNFLTRLEKYLQWIAAELRK